MEKNDLVTTPLSMLERFGFCSKTKFLRIVFMSILFLMSTLFLSVISAVQFPLIKGNISDFALNAEAFEAYIQVGAKFLITLYQQNDFRNLVNITKSFWPTSRCSTAVKIKLDNILMRTLKLERAYLLIALTASAFAIIPILLGKSLAVGIWIIEGHQVLHVLVMGIEMYYVPMLSCLVFGFDSLFLGLCVKVAVQFKILFHSIREIKVSDGNNKGQSKNYHDQLQLCIKHHIFLLRFLESLRTTYSFTLLVQYGTSSTLICVDMYSFFEDKDVTLQARHGMVILTQTVQLSFYCLAADYVTYEALKVSDAYFHSKWYLQSSTSHTTLRTTTTMAIQKSQQEIIFTAGGLIDFNSRALLNVLKASYSICTVMRQIRRVN